MTNPDSYGAQLLAAPELLKNLLNLQKDCDGDEGLGFVKSAQNQGLGIVAGTEVRIHGIASRPELNGSMGTVLRESDDKARWVVQLRSEVSFKSDNLERLNGTSSPAGYVVADDQDKSNSSHSLGIRVGDEVRIHGIVARPDHNGSSGIVLRESDDKSRWVVQLTSEVSLKSDNLESLNVASNPAGSGLADSRRKCNSSRSFGIAAGDAVRIHGIVKRPELNGSSGIVLCETDDKSRWVVQLKNEELSLKAENLERQHTTSNPANIQKKWLTLDRTNIWECSEKGIDGSGDLRVIGRARNPQDGEKDFAAVVEVVFRSTVNIQNWVTNFTANLKPCPFAADSGRVHNGFLRAYFSLQTQVKSNIQKSLAAYKYDKDNPVLVYCIGYSLGGALATLAAFDLATSSGSDVYAVRCVTWGCPRVGDGTFAAKYISKIPKTARFVNARDVVPRVPVNADDANDDGRVFGDDAFARFLQRQHERVGAHEYVHVCPGTLLGKAKTHAALIFDTLKSVEEHGLTGLANMFQPHLLNEYSESLDRKLAGDSGDANAEGVNLLEAGKTVSNLFSKMFAPRSR